MTDIDEIYDYDPSCKECRDGWVRSSTGGWRRCKCYFEKMKKRKTKRILATYPMPERLKEKRFVDYIAKNGSQERALTKMSNGEPCYLFGPYGTGKTHLLAAAINMKLCQNIPAMLVSAPWLFEELRRDMFRNNDTKHKVIDDACSINYLAIDDLCKEKLSAMVEEKLFMIVDRRLNKHLLTSFSSNFPLDSQNNKLDGAIKSRIHEMCEVICVKGRDYRYAK